MTEELRQRLALIAAAPDLLAAAKALLADVLSRHPNEQFQCPHMLALALAVAKSENRE